MRTGFFVVLMFVAVAAVFTAAPASAETSHTVDHIVAVRMDGVVMWGNEEIWKFQVFSGPGNAAQPLVVPPGATIRYELEPVGTDPNKRIDLTIDSASEVQADYGAFWYNAQEDGMILVRTEYIRAVRDARPLIKLFIGIGTKVTRANTKGAWIFPVNTVESVPVNCADDARLAMLFGRSAGSPVGMDLAALAAPQGATTSTTPVPTQEFADGPATDRNFERQAEMNARLLERDDIIVEAVGCAQDTADEALALAIQTREYLESQTSASSHAPAPASPAVQQVVILLHNPSNQTVVRQFWFKGDSGWVPCSSYTLQMAPGADVRWEVPPEALRCQGWDLFAVGYVPTPAAPCRYGWDNQTVEVR